VVTGFTVACYRLSQVFPIVDAHHNWRADKAGLLSMNSVLDFDFAKRTNSSRLKSLFFKEIHNIQVYYYYYYYLLLLLLLILMEID
jgi:hypothetical protein